MNRIHTHQATTRGVAHVMGQGLWEEDLFLAAMIVNNHSLL